jgi:hypothetical protein
MPNLIALRAAALVRDAGGEIVGRTRFQKIAYLLSVTGLGEDLHFVYKHYGPYSDELASGASDASRMGLLTETEYQASWGGTYSVYRGGADSGAAFPPARNQLARAAAAADSVELELAATAVFLSKAGYDDPWAETARRKPEKSRGGTLAKAKVLYRELSRIETPEPLPRIA